MVEQIAALSYAMRETNFLPGTEAVFPDLDADKDLAYAIANLGLAAPEPAKASTPSCQWRANYLADYSNNALVGQTALKRDPSHVINRRGHDAFSYNIMNLNHFVAFARRTPALRTMCRQ